MNAGKRYGIAIFHNLGDVLACTPIAKQLKADDPDCHIVCFTSVPGEQALRLNPYIDEITVLPGNPHFLDSKIRTLAEKGNWTRFFAPAAYMNYDVVPGGSRLNPKGSIFGIVKAAAKLHWTVPFVFPFRLAEEEKEQARAFLSALPPGIRILVESETESNQSPWRDDWSFDLLESLRTLDPLFIFTAKDCPAFFQEFRARGGRAVFCSLPFRLNAEIFNSCDAFIGVASGISCLTYSDYCRTDIPRIEISRGEHWGAAELPHHHHLHLCYSRRKFREALENVKAQLLREQPVPDFSPRLPAEIRFLGHCPYCGSTEQLEVRPGSIYACSICRAQYSTATSVRPDSRLSIDFIGERCRTVDATAFLQADSPPAAYRQAFLSGNLGSVPALRELLEKIQWSLEPGGSLLLTTANFNGLLSQALGKQWPRLEENSTLWYFSPLFLREMLLEAGFFVESWHSEYSEDSEALLRAEMPALNPLLSPAEQNYVVDETGRRGEADTICITAVKRGGYKGRILSRSSDAQDSPVHSSGMGAELVSFVIPCFNGRRYLEEAFRSVLAQTYLNWELIVVDDGSTDGSAELAEQLAQELPPKRIRVLRTAHRGAAAARDAGCALARGEWLVPLDADDQLQPLFLERLLTEAHRNPDAAILFCAQEMFGCGKKVWIPGEFQPGEALNGQAYPTTVLMKREFRQAFGAYNIGSPLASSAQHFWLSAVACRVKTVFVPDILVQYRVTPAGQLHQQTMRHWKLARAFVRTAHPALFPAEELQTEHHIIAAAADDFLDRVSEQIALFPDLDLPHLWRGLMLESIGLFNQALEEFAAARQRSRPDDRQAESCLQRLSAILSGTAKNETPIAENVEISVLPDSSQLLGTNADKLAAVLRSVMFKL
jgi:hypothetical protein